MHEKIIGDRISIASSSNFYTPTNGLSPDSVHNPVIENKSETNDEEERRSLSSQSTLNFGKEPSCQDKTSSRSSFSEFCLESDSWIEQDVFKDENGTEDTDIVSSFSTFNKMMEELNQDHRKTETEPLFKKGTMSPSCVDKDDPFNGKLQSMNIIKDPLPISECDEIKKLITTDERNGTKDAIDMKENDTKDIEVENVDEKTSSEGSSSYSGGYVRLEDRDQTVHIDTGSEGSAESPHGCSTTPLLNSPENSPVNSCDGDQADKVVNGSDSEDGKYYTSFWTITALCEYSILYSPNLTLGSSFCI